MKLLTSSREILRDALQNLKQRLRAANRHRLYRRRMKKGVDYASWITSHDTPTDADRKAWASWLSSQPGAPMVSLILNVKADSDPAQLQRSIASVQIQAYPNWQLLIALPGLSQPKLAPSMSADARIQILSAQQDPMTHVSGAWTALLEVGDQLREQSLLLMMQAAFAHPDAKIIYPDDDCIDRQGRRHDHHFKPDWNYDFQLSANYIGHACLISTPHVLAAGGYVKQARAGDVYGTLLRCVEGLDDRQIIHVSHVLWHHVPPTVRRALDATFVQALQAHLDRAYPDAKASTTPEGFLRVHHALPAPPPLVSIVICTRNQYQLLRTCIQSITQKTTYPRYEIIIVDNGSDEGRTLAYLQQLAQENTRIRVVRDDSPFNYAALNNMAVSHAQGDVVALLNNDIEVIGSDWLTEMVAHALRPEIGCVGAKLLYPDDTVQHAGVLVGSGHDAPDAVAAHYLRGIPREAPGYANRAIVTHQLTAVTAACLVIRKATFTQVGGLDSKNLAVTYNDVDFCLRVGELGLQNVWTPHALLYHHESVSRGRDASSKNIERFRPELAYMQRRWACQLKHDPHYNVNLSHAKPDFLLSNN